MFEWLEARARRRAQERAAARREELARRFSGALPPGVRAEAVEEGVRLSGRGLRRRFARDTALRWLIVEEVK